MANENNTVMGLPTQWVDDPEQTVSPYSAITVVKGINGDGNEVFMVVNTEGLSNIEALGFLNFGLLYIQDEIRAELYQAYRAQDENGSSAQK